MKITIQIECEDRQELLLSLEVIKERITKAIADNVIPDIIRDAKAKTSKKEIEAAILKFFRRNKVFPSQQQVAILLGVTERTIRRYYPNGSWDTLIDSLQPETSAAN